MTMEIHWSKHHQTYVNNLNGAVEKAPELAGMSLSDIVKSVGTDKVPASVATVVRNNGGGASVEDCAPPPYPGGRTRLDCGVGAAWRHRSRRRQLWGTPDTHQGPADRWDWWDVVGPQFGT